MTTKTPQAELLAWYVAVGRDLPWRRTRDPYRILVSEVMLQQTQVARVIPYYERFLARFPHERALAQAATEDLHRLWKGLGYPNRVERLRTCAQAVLARGAWPTTPEALQELPGIGPYTAHAVACFAFEQVVPVVDTNVARVYARRDGLPLPLTKDALWTHVATQVDRREPRLYNNALMDLGATLCTARVPSCGACPWEKRCVAKGKSTVIGATSNPLKVASAKSTYGVDLPKGMPRLHIVLGLIHEGGRYLIAKRKADAHVGGFWELPGGKREPGENDRNALARELQEEIGGELLSARALMSYHHAYPDRALTFHVYRCRLFNPHAVRPLVSQELRWVTPEELITVDMPPGSVPMQQRMRKYHRLQA